MGKPILDESAMLRLPCGCTTLSRIRENKAIYVDKTEKVSTLAKNCFRPVFLSRPRRFGKSLLVSVFESLFSKGLEDFKDLAIEKDDYWKNEKTYKVVHLDFSSYATEDLSGFKLRLNMQLLCALKDKTIEELSDVEKSLPPAAIIEQQARLAKHGSLVLLIDEYDAPITHSMDNREKMREMIDFISSFFATIKSCEKVFRFVFITGITRLAHVSLFSMFNNLLDITADDDYSGLLGITEEELHKYFDEYVRNAASVLDMSKEEVYARMKSAYNGFQFTINAKETVYNPWSILSFLSNPKKGFANYWYSTSGGTPTILVEYLKKNEKLNLFNMLRYRVSSIDGKIIQVDEDSLLSKSEPDKIPMDMLLLQTGYFTLKSKNDYLAKLVIPNDEIAESLIKLSLDIQNLGPSEETTDKISSLSELIDSGDIDSVFSLFNTLLCECVSSSSKVFNDENSVRDVIYSQIRGRRIYKAREVINSQGYSDLELKTSKTKLVIEFKRIQESGGEESAIKEAISQMRTHHYGETTEDIKLIRAAMIICTAKRSLTAYRVME
jgi:hypothetical protein